MNLSLHLLVILSLGARPPQAPPIGDRPPQAPPIASKSGEPFPGYAALYDRAVREGRPLVIFVGCSEKVSGNWITKRVSSLGTLTSAVVIGVPDSGRKGLYRKVLAPSSTVQDIQRAIYGAGGVDPFEWSNRRSQVEVRQTPIYAYYAPPYSQTYRAAPAYCSGGS